GFHPPLLLLEGELVATGWAQASSWKSLSSGLTFKGNQVTGGSFCLFRSRPYQVVLLRNGRIYCVGSLIAPKWVLTAAHCAFNYLKEGSKENGVRLFSVEGTEQIRRIHNFFMHPGYNLHPRDNDFMLLELDEPAQLNNYVNTINMTTHCPSPGTRCSVSGWGTIKSPQSIVCWGVEARG
uniref:Peptidase S1 domain-containing protein n=1 Tax=Gopherus agassizii TaxID=38772 RepID=A0A452IGG1_9SAUR